MSSDERVPSGALKHPKSAWAQWGGFLRANERWLLPGAWLITMGLGFAGFGWHFQAAHKEASVADRLYAALQLFRFSGGQDITGGGWLLAIARWLAPLVAGYTFFRALFAIFVQQWHIVRTWFASEHVVVCGLGSTGYYLTQGFLAQGRQVVVIEHDPIRTLVECCRDSGAIVLAGNASDRKVLQRARIHRAAYVFIVCGDDSTNAEVAEEAHGLVCDARRLPAPLTCVVQIEEPHIYHHLREGSMCCGHSRHFRVQFFNTCELGARLLLEKYPLILPDAGTAVPMPQPLVIGIGKLGERLIVEMASAWQSRPLPLGPAPAPAPQKLHIRILDQRADEKKTALNQLYPILGEVCELESVKTAVGSPDFRRCTFLRDAQGRICITDIYICMDNDALSLATGLALLEQLSRTGSHVPVVVRLRHEAGLPTLLGSPCLPSTACEAMRPFGVLNHVCTPDLLGRLDLETIAIAIHDKYVQEQIALGQTFATNPLIRSWRTLSGDLQESNRQQAAHIVTKLKAIGYGLRPTRRGGAAPFTFDPEDIEFLARMEHDRYVDERRRAGWKYAPGPKDLALKTNPTLVPWRDLPEDEKVKDRIAIASIPDLLARVGFEIYRPPEGATDVTRASDR